MGRITSLTEELQKKIVERLVAGASILDTCRDVGISEASFYNWTKRGRKEKQRLEQSGTRERKSERVYLKFLEATTQARGRAKMTALSVVARSMFDSETVTESTETVSETRLRRGKDGVQEPYIYTKTVTRRSVTKSPPDWRLAIEFLKRRYREEWSEKMLVEANEDPQGEMADLIRKGELAIDDVIAAFGNVANFKEWMRKGGDDDTITTQLLKEAGWELSQDESEDA